MSAQAPEAEPPRGRAGRETEACRTAQGPPEDRGASLMGMTRSPGSALEVHAGTPQQKTRGPETTIAPPTPGSSGFGSVENASPLQSAAGPFEGQPHQAERTVRMEYAYEQAEGQSVGRWVARLTEFLRATTARSAGFQGRFLEGLGIAGTQANGSSFYPQDSMTQPYMQQHLQQAAAAMSSTRSYPQQAAAAISSTRMTQQQHAAAMTSTGVLSRQAPTTVPFSEMMPTQAMQISPPEELPPAPATPRKTSTPTPRRLFSPEQVRRMREQEREAPQLYGPQTEPASTSSSEIQAEVQRQLRQYVQRYEGVANSLRGQLEEVQRERDELLARQQHGVPTGDRAPLHAAWSTNRRSGTLAAWSTNRRSGTLAAWSTSRRSGTLAAWSTSRRSGTLAAWSTSRRSGTPAAWSTSRRSGTLAAWSTSRRSGTLAAWSASRRSDTPAAWSTSRRSGTDPSRVCRGS